MLYKTGDSKERVLYHSTDSTCELNGFNQNGTYKSPRRPSVDSSFKLPTKNTLPTRRVESRKSATQADVDKISVAMTSTIDKNIGLGRGRVDMSFPAPGLDPRNMDQRWMPSNNYLDAMAKLGILSGPSAFTKSTGMGTRGVEPTYTAASLYGGSDLSGFSLKSVTNAVKSIGKVAFALPRLATASVVRAVGARSTAVNKALGITSKEEKLVEQYGRKAVWVAAGTTVAVLGTKAVIAASAQAAQAHSAALAAQAGFGGFASTNAAANASAAAAAGYGGFASTASAASAATSVLSAVTKGAVSVAKEVGRASLPVLISHALTQGGSGPSYDAQGQPIPTDANVTQPSVLENILNTLPGWIPMSGGPINPSANGSAYGQPGFDPNYSGVPGGGSSGGLFTDSPTPGTGPLSIVNAIPMWGWGAAAFAAWFLLRKPSYTVSYRRRVA